MERARETGLFRYSLVQELLEPGLSLAERGWRARELAGRAHEGPGGRRVTVSYATLTRWRRRYEEGGFDALVPSPRQPAPRTPEEVLALAEALKREKPGRTAAQVRRVLQVTSGWAPSDRTLQRLFERLELNRPAPGPEEEQRALGRFECTRPNEMWTGDLCRPRRYADLAVQALLVLVIADRRRHNHRDFRNAMTASGGW